MTSYTPNEFRYWIDVKTAGMPRKPKEEYKRFIATKLKISMCVFKNWYQGVTEPKILEKKSINEILKENIFKIS